MPLALSGDCSPFVHLCSLDLRLNDFDQISVAEDNEPQLKRLMKAGTLQIDNVIPASCDVNSELKRIRGLPQTFSVCVFESSSASFSSATSVAGEAADPRQTRVKSTSNVNATELESSASTTSDPSPVPTVSAPSSSSSNTSTTTTATGGPIVSTSLFVMLIMGISVVVVSVLAIGCWLVSRRQTSEAASNNKPSDELRPTISLLASIMTNKNPTFASTPSQNSSDSSSSLSSVAMLEAGQADPRTDSSRIVLRSEAGYMNLLSPPLPSQANAGSFTNASHPTEHGDVEVTRRTRVAKSPLKTSRLAERKRLRLALESLCGSHSIIRVSGSEFRCCGPMEETPLAYIVPCVRANEQPNDQHSTKLKLKLFIQQDVMHAANEYRAINALRDEQPNDSQSTVESMEKLDESVQVAPQLVAVDMDMALPAISAEDGVNASVRCSGLVLDATSATTLLHLVRGQMDKSSQLAVAQQLYSVLCALSALHSQHFVHGSLHLEALVVDPDSGRLAFRDLEHARPFGAPMRSYARSAVEFVPPEMAIHLLCETAMMDPAQHESHRATTASRRTSTAVVLPADPSFDVWSLGVLLLRMYASCKHLGEFRGCDEAVDVLLRAADPDFSLERSIELYVLHGDVRDLIRQCLQRDPLLRPTLESVFEHPVFLNAVAVVSETSATLPRPSQLQQNDLQLDHYLVEQAPPSLWMFLPPVEIGLDGCRSVDEWVVILTKLQHQAVFDAKELHFPLLWVCESSWSLSTPCGTTGLQNSSLSVPVSLLSIVVPLVQETTLFLEAKAILSHDTTHSSRALHIGQVSGLGPKQWIELMKFYRALEKMLLAPVTSFSLLMLKPLEELLASGDPAAAQQVLDEVKCLSFSQEKRAHIHSLMELLVSPSALLPAQDHETEWCALHRYELERETSLSMTSTRWLCCQHAP